MAEPRGERLAMFHVRRQLCQRVVSPVHVAVVIVGGTQKEYGAMDVGRVGFRFHGAVPDTVGIRGPGDFLRGAVLGNVAPVAVPAATVDRAHGLQTRVHGKRPDRGAAHRDAKGPEALAVDFRLRLQIGQRPPGQRRPQIPRRNAHGGLRGHDQGRGAVLCVVIALLERFGKDCVALPARPFSVVIAGEAGVAPGGPGREPPGIGRLPAAVQVQHRGHGRRPMRRGENAIHADRLPVDVGGKVDFLVVRALFTPSRQHLFTEIAFVGLVVLPDLRWRHGRLARGVADFQAGVP
jgi:hypothetical protein